MRKYRRHGIIVIFVVAALLTPPDPMTQIFMGIPLLLLYELSVYIVRSVERGNLKRERKFQEELEREARERAAPEEPSHDS